MDPRQLFRPQCTRAVHCGLFSCAVRTYLMALDDEYCPTRSKMNPLFIGTLFFGCRNFGWAEVYPLNAVTYPTATVALSSILEDRLPTMCGDVTCLGGRVSDQNVRGDSQLIHLPVPPTGTYVGAALTITYDSEVTLQWRFEATPQHRVVRSVRAIPSDQFENGVYTPVGGWFATLTTWALLVQNLCSISTAIKPRPPAAPYYIFTPMTNNIFGKQSHRKIGRPFGLLVGRRRIA